MEGPSSKQANVYSDNPGIHNMDTFNYPAPPPAYQTDPNPPHNPEPGATVIQHPTVTVTQHQYPGVTVTQQQYPGVTVTQQQYPGVAVTQQPGVTVVQPGNSIVYLQPLLGKVPTGVQCRSCNYQTTTRVEFQPSTRTHLCALLICILFWPCVWVPYVTNDCKSAQHYCSNCGSFIGTSL